MNKLLLGVLAATVFFLPACASQSSAFQEAKQKPELREAYIVELAKKTNPPPELAEIVFVNSPAEYDLVKGPYGKLKPNETGLMMTEVVRDSAENFTARIFIFENAFTDSAVQEEADFLSGLKHEYVHIEMERKGQFFGKISWEEIIKHVQEKEKPLAFSLVTTIAELTATGSEFQNTDLSPKYKNMLINNYMRYYTGLWNFEEEIDASFLNSLKKEFFLSWMAKFLWQDEQERLHLRHPKSGKVYLLPEEIKMLAP